MSEGKVFWCLRVLCRGGEWVWALEGGHRFTAPTRAAAFRKVSNYSSYDDFRLVKVTRRPKAKPVSREVWEGTVREWPAYAQDYAVLVGATNVAGGGPACGDGARAPHGLLASRLIGAIGKRARITQEVF